MCRISMLSFASRAQSQRPSSSAGEKGNQEHKTTTHNKDILFPFNDARREKLNSVQEFVEVEPWLLLIFLTCLHNQLKFNYKFL